jgi:hypothetical protein
LLLGVFVVELAVPAIAGWDLSYSVWAAPYVLVLLVTVIGSATLIYRGRFGDDPAAAIGVIRTALAVDTAWRAGA